MLTITVQFPLIFDLGVKTKGCIILRLIALPLVPSSLYFLVAPRGSVTK
jgi:hypothetical protein